MAAAKKSKSNKKPSSQTTPVKAKPNPSLSDSLSPKTAFINRHKNIIIGAVLLLAILGLVFKNKIVVATVNGKPITWLSYYQEMETLSGPAILNQLITQELVKQEAGKQNLTVSREELDAEINSIKQSIESQGQEFNQVLDDEGYTLAMLEAKITTQKLIEKLTADSVKVTDEEVDQYIEDNKEILPDNDDPESLKEFVRDSLEQGKQQEYTESYLQGLHELADVAYW